VYEMYEDQVRQGKTDRFENRYSPHCDAVSYRSSRDPSLRLAMRVLKPERPSDILVTTHGWHMSMPEYEAMDAPPPGLDCLTLQVDMRGRAFSEGRPDCNGWELLDLIDAVAYARVHYREWLRDDALVYFEGGSGGGGNAYAVAGKFPDFFAAVTALYGITDYDQWYRRDSLGEFRDEMDVWIGTTPDQNPMAYQSRSGIWLLENLHAPLLMIHGERDARCPVEQARRYVERATVLGQTERIQYLELPGVGGRSHLERATPEQLDRIAALSRDHRAANRKPVFLPERGRLVVAGYLFTKRFSVVLDSIDKMATVDYDLARNAFQITSRAECQAKINTAEEGERIVHAGSQAE
jgi:pimeloyl-ACP methyl ester carboxylesterase